MIVISALPLMFVKQERTTHILMVYYQPFMAKDAKSFCASSQTSFSASLGIIRTARSHAPPQCETC